MKAELTGEFAIVGAGAAAAVFACELAEAGAGVRIWARRPEAAKELAERTGPRCRAASDLDAAFAGAEAVLICVTDRALGEVVELAAKSNAPAVALHTSGYHDSSLLEPLGGERGSLHPVRPLARRAVAPGSLRGAHFAFEGSGAARAVAEKFAEVCGATLFDLPAERNAKHAYHAAAALLSNGAVALFDMALELAGGHEGVAPAFLDLLSATVDNLEKLGSPAALTGPALRGDAEVLAGHIAQLDSEQLALYGHLTRRMLDLALQRDALSPDQVKQLRKLL